MNITIQGYNGKLLAAEGGGGQTGSESVVNARTLPSRVGPWERFVETPLDSGCVSIKTESGFYLSAQRDGTLEANRLVCGPWERFKKHPTAIRNQVGYQSDAWGTWLCCDLNRPVADSHSGWSGHRVTCDRYAMGPWEVFALRPEKYDPEPRSILTLPAGTYDRELLWNPPLTRDYLRADCWGITLPGLPVVQGGSTKHPERFLSWFFDRYPIYWQEVWLEQNQRNGYTHAFLSLPDSLAFGTSFDDFLAICGRVRLAVPYVAVFLGSKVYQPHDMGVQQWLDYAVPPLQRLLDAQVIDEIVPGWEWDAWNIPGETTIRVFKALGSLAHGSNVSCWMHFTSGKTSWFADKEPRMRYGFYDDIGTDVDGVLYQTGAPPDPRHAGWTLREPWSIEETQARIVDSLMQFAKQGNRHKFRFFEDLGWLQFDDDWSEDQANLRGYLGCCTVDHRTPSDTRVWGFGGGARLPSGWPF